MDLKELGISLYEKSYQNLRVLFSKQNGILIGFWTEYKEDMDYWMGRCLVSSDLFDCFPLLKEYLTEGELLLYFHPVLKQYVGELIPKDAQRDSVMQGVSSHFELTLLLEQLNESLKMTNQEDIIPFTVSLERKHYEPFK